MQIKRYRVFAPGIADVPTPSGLFFSSDVAEDRRKISECCPGLDFRIEAVNTCGMSLTETPRKLFASREERVSTALAMLKA